MMNFQMYRNNRRNKKDCNLNQAVKTLELMRFINKLMFSEKK
jgi:hypothetical protein